QNPRVVFHSEPERGFSLRTLERFSTHKSLHDQLHDPPVRARPSFFGQRLLETDLPLRERRRILEPLDALAAIGLGNDQLVKSVVGLACLTAYELPFPLKEPNHRTPIVVAGRTCSRIAGSFSGTLQCF